MIVEARSDALVLPLALSESGRRGVPLLMRCDSAKDELGLIPEIESITSLVTQECRSALSCGSTVEQCFHLAFPLPTHRRPSLEQFAEMQNLPPVSPVPSRNLVVDCKDSRAVIVIFGTHRVAQLLRDFGQRDVVGAFCDANLTFGGMFFFRDLFELTDAPDAQDDKSSWRVPDDAGL